mgnify:CR=1 FL=1
MGSGHSPRIPANWSTSGLNNLGGGRGRKSPHPFFLFMDGQIFLNSPWVLKKKIFLFETFFSSWSRDLSRKKEKTEFAERSWSQKGRQRRKVGQSCPPWKEGTWARKIFPKFWGLSLRRRGATRILKLPSVWEGLELGSLNYRFRTVHKVSVSMQNEGFCYILNQATDPRSKLPKDRKKKPTFSILSSIFLTPI